MQTLRDALSSDRDRAAFDDLSAGRPTVWIPGDAAPTGDGETLTDLPALVDRAEARFRWFAPLIEELFPGTRELGGIIESPLTKVSALSDALSQEFGRPVPRNLWVKRDDVLAVSGSVKSRGGIHEVLETALTVAADLGVDLSPGPTVFLERPVREKMATRRIVVGSTGNLGMSIGLMGAVLGFSVTVHMSHDAKQWKKDKLRNSGVEVVEHDTDFTEAVHAGRRAADADPRAHFIDDENSRSLFAGYAVAGRRLVGQLAAASVQVDEEHPLTVYLPCGIGGAPGGITYGLSTVFGDNVRCVFVEPVSMPAFMLGRLTGLDDGVSVTDIGRGELTVADGLAVGRPSGFVGATVGGLIAGYATVTDDDLMRALALAYDISALPLEPSACAGLLAAGCLEEGEPDNPGAHIAWLTGGSLMPDHEFAVLLEAGRRMVTAGTIS
ncbi:D-serine ammonia-lyase [Corynebacterium sp. CNJ-954]|uniref:D-serine ammonia-lyase n=1 Tax=Corynebacterium sp. CNJ-954 TaxID=1904962 RepID=UPI0009617623|nr:D-serine ammonia-lyase [Corynebacterium sp. CNJ-954]OLT53653.1 D-serine ammonia-lyase [Corynebacterium sp. CNJ-954]